MTAKNFGMMVIGMMLIGTTTVFGKTNTAVHNDRHHNGHTEVVVINNAPVHSHTPNYRNMDNRMVKHILEGRHSFDRHGDCRVCHMNAREILSVERDIRNHMRTPMARPNHFRR